MENEVNARVARDIWEDCREIGKSEGRSGASQMTVFLRAAIRDYRRGHPRATQEPTAKYGENADT
jgi:hypothetical protein